MTDPLGAFVPVADVRVAGAAEGPLAGLSFAVKDLIDVAGHVTGCGNPDWAATHPIPDKSASVVEALLAAGASIVGKTVTDEISLGLLGINRFDGTPLNPRAPDRVPGGSSSGSASAVAGGACDFALGTDSGGSVRVPASFCGLWPSKMSHHSSSTGRVARARSSMPCTPTTRAGRKCNSEWFTIARVWVMAPCQSQSSRAMRTRFSSLGSETRAETSNSGKRCVKAPASSSRLAQAQK